MADPLSEKWVDLRLLATMRVVLGASALLVVFVDPSEPNRWAFRPYIVLFIYTLYGLAIYILTARRHPVTARSLLPWIDLLWTVPLAVFAAGSPRVFYYFFFFPIIAAAFVWGLTAGARVTLTAASFLTIAGKLAAPPGQPVELDRLLLPPIGLLIFGYLMSRWGGFKAQMRNRLQLLKDVTVFSNPRFGIDRTIREILERVREFYGAKSCMLIVPKSEDGNVYQIYKTRRRTAPVGSSPPELDRETARIFLHPSNEHALLYQKWHPRRTVLFDVMSRQASAGSAAEAEKLSGLLDAENYVSIPVAYRHGIIGRLYITDVPRRLDNADLNFLIQLMDHVTPVTENIRLVDNLASDAAEHERRRIGHDIHDSVIQPYLGLQFGLVALHQKLQKGDGTASRDVDELLDLTNHELAQLRRYVRGLRVGEERSDVLLPALQRYAARFSTVTGIQVEVAAAGPVKLSDRLAGELFQIVTEGLSNIRRHAFCNDARIELSCNQDSVILQIKNGRSRINGDAERTAPDTTVSFKPRSIAERAALLGGETRVFVDELNYTVVRVGIPL